MRNMLAGFAVLSLLAVGTVVPALARPLPVPSAEQSPAIQQADWDNCGPRCREHRREVRERALEQQRRAEYRHSQDHRRWEEGRQYPPASYGHYNRY
jgi:hypothetical protein